MKPVLNKEYMYFGQFVKVTRINSYPFIDINGVETTKHEVTIETRMGETAQVDFDDLEEKPKAKSIKSKNLKAKRNVKK